MSCGAVSPICQEGKALTRQVLAVHIRTDAEFRQVIDIYEVAMPSPPRDGVYLSYVSTQSQSKNRRSPNDRLARIIEGLEKAI